MAKPCRDPLRSEHGAEPVRIEADRGSLVHAGEANRHYSRARVHVRANEWQKAIAAYAEAVRLDPDNGQAQNGYAWLLATCPAAEFRDAAAALKHAEKAVNVAPLDAMAWNTTGVARYRAGDWPGAIAALKRSEELAPAKCSAFNAFFMAMAHWRLGGMEEKRPNCWK